MELSSALSLEMLGKPFLLDKRIILLYAIEEHGSISKAAKAVPMSYKSAWEAVDTMNTLSPEPIVCRETGGKDGGGTTLTTYGETLLENYALIKEEHKRFLERLSDLADIKSGAFKTIGRLAMQLSARNQIQATIKEINSHELSATITLMLKSGQVLLSIITQEAVENLQLKVGETAIIICKSSMVKVSKERKMDNSLRGTICKIELDEQHTKIVVDVGNHDKVVSVMSCEETKKILLRENDEVYVNIDNNAIMLGK